MRGPIEGWKAVQAAKDEAAELAANFELSQTAWGEPIDPQSLFRGNESRTLGAVNTEVLMINIIRQRGMARVSGRRARRDRKRVAALSPEEQRIDSLAHRGIAGEAAQLLARGIDPRPESAGHDDEIPFTD